MTQVAERIEQIKRGEIPSGYVKTKDGIFPADWSTKRIEDWVSLCERPIELKDEETYQLVTVRRAFGGVDSRGYYKGKDILVKTYFEVRKGDFVISKRQIAHGACGVVPDCLDHAVVSNEYNVFVPKDKTNIAMFYLMMHLPHYLRLFYLMSDGVHIEKLLFKTDDWLRRSLAMPPLQEQRKIAEILSTQDRVIALYDQKIEQLRLLKKYCLKEMFPRRGSNIPEVHFPGFTYPWEQRKLSAIVDRITRKNDGLQSSLPLTISAQYGLVDQITYFNKRVASQNVADYYLIKKGEFAYNKSTSESFPFGAIKRLDLYDMGVLSTLYIVFSLRPNLIDSDYMVTYFETDLWHKQISERAEEGARNHGLLNITADDFFDISLLTPCSIDEQKQIGNYFKRLDELILLYQRKRGQETEKKKTLMQLLLSGTIRVNNIGGII